MKPAFCSCCKRDLHHQIPDDTKEVICFRCANLRKVIPSGPRPLRIREPGYIAVEPELSLLSVAILRQYCQLLLNFHSTAMELNDGIQVSPSDGSVTYTGSNNTVDLLRERDATITSFVFRHFPD